MPSENPPPAATRRNRLIAIAAGVITVGAITLALASGYLGLTWLWLRPAAELLLLAELVGLIVLERHQLFEPVHTSVDGMHSLVREIHAIVTDEAHSSNRVTACATSPELFATGIRVLREALGRDQTTPQILRVGRLSGRMRVFEDPDLSAEFRSLSEAMSAFFLPPGTSSDARARRWSVRAIFAIASRENFDSYLEQLRENYGTKPLNVETKVFVRPSVDAVLAPMAITDRDALLSYDDAAASFRWGFRFQGQEYRALLERWFDDLWANIPDVYLIYSRGAWNERAVERIRRELDAAQAADERKIA